MLSCQVATLPQFQRLSFAVLETPRPCGSAQPWCKQSLDKGKTLTCLQTVYVPPYMDVMASYSGRTSSLLISLEAPRVTIMRFAHDCLPKCKPQTQKQKALPTQAHCQSTVLASRLWLSIVLGTLLLATPTRRLPLIH